ncbi:MAG: trigger factor [bacterium]|nr:trigger factor [bacterium]MDZ4284897.1 trigger factor [Patescibacteria group bacterium]
MADEPLYANIVIRETGPAEAEIRGEISLARVENHRAAVLRALQGRVSLPGFRPGHISENILLSHVGEAALFEDMAELAIREAYPRIIEEQRLAPIGKPSVSLTRCAPGNPVGFLIRTALMPTVTLPDYRAIAREIFGGKEVAVEITEQEVADALLQIRQALATRQKRNAAAVDGDKNTEPPPELTDELVKDIGSFASVADFTEKLRGQIKYEKGLRLAEKKRIEASERLVERSQTTIPAVITESELEALLARFMHDIERSGAAFPDYLAHIGKSEEDIRRDLRPKADKNAKLQVVLNEIARAENLRPQNKEIERLTTLALKREPKADPEAARAHITMMLANEAVFQFLEKEGAVATQ